MRLGWSSVRAAGSGDLLFVSPRDWLYCMSLGRNSQLQQISRDGEFCQGVCESVTPTACLPIVVTSSANMSHAQVLSLVFRRVQSVTNL